MEEWRDIPGTNGKYQVSNLGRVRNVRCRGKQRCREVSLILREKGYVVVNLQLDNGKSKQMFVHRLVAMAFIPNSNNYPIINHKDENKANNCVDNLEWCDYSYNQKYALNLHPERIDKYLSNFIDKETGRRKESLSRRGIPISRKEPVIQKTLEGDVVKYYDNASAASKETDICSRDILNACQRNKHNETKTSERMKYKKKKCTAKGYIWEFAE